MSAPVAAEEETEKCRSSVEARTCNVRKQDCSRWKLEGADGCAGNAALADALQAVQTGLDWLASGDSLTAHGRR